MKMCGIYDFETLSTDTNNGVILSVGALKFDEDRFTYNPYTFEELVESASFLKFDVEDQVKNYGRTISKDTVDWWLKIPNGKDIIKPTKNDVPITELERLFYTELELQSCRYVYVRGVNFDATLLGSVMKSLGKKDPISYFKVRDTRSMIHGMTYGHDIDDRFMPPEFDESKFEAHNPLHDISMDVLRLQYLARLYND